MASKTYSAGTAFLTVVPSFRGIEDAFKAQVRQMAQAADKDLAAGMARGLKDAQRQGKGAGAAAGKEFGGAYQAEAKKKLEAAWQSLPEPQPGVNLRKWDKALAKVRSEMAELSGQRIGIDIDQKTFDRAIDDFRRKLEGLRDSATGQNREVGFFNANQSAKMLAGLQEFTRQAARQAGEAGEQVGSAFNQRMARVLKDSLDKIPPIKLTADSSDAERRIAAVQEQLVDLQSKQIGVDIDAGSAYAELRAIFNELQRLDRSNVRVDIRTNAHEAAAGMGQFIQQAELAGQATQSIGQRANFSMSRLEYLIALGASLGTTIVPAALAAAGAVGLLGTSALAAGAGLGVFGLGLSGISEAVKALNGYAQDQAKSSNSVEQANRRVAGSTDQVRMAQLALANTRRTVAEAAEDAARRVADAERGVAEARRTAQRELADAARAVVDAKRAAVDAEDDVADARRQARLDLVEADRQVRDAQRGVTDAEKDALDARKALNEAIREAAQDIRELDTALARNSQEQSKAVTSQLEALEELNALRMNPRATEVELRRAEDAYNEQTVRLKELQDQQRRLRDEKARADKLGVEGDEKVIAVRKKIANADEQLGKAREKLAREQDQRVQIQIRAQERISDAQERAARSQEQVIRAQQQQRDTEIRAQERIADAQRQVADARRQQARQSRDGEYQLATASNAVTQAQRSQKQAFEQTGTAGGAALKKLNDSMDKLSPAGQRFAKFIFGLKDEVQGLRAAAAEPLLPALEEAITLLLPYLPSLEGFIGKIATVMGELSIKAVKALGDPVWQRFFGYIDKTAGPALERMYEIGQNTAQGLISLFLALTPFNDQAGAGLVELSRDFAMWAERLDKSQGYQEFLQYVRENGPRVVHLLGEMGELLIDLVKAAAPLGEAVLKGLTLVVDALNSIPSGVLPFLVLGIAAVAAGLTVLGAVMRVQRLGTQLSGIFGPRASDMVQRYAFETGRATTETSRFGKAAATVSGVAAAASARVQGMATAVGALGGKVTGATTAVGGPGGFSAAVQTAKNRMTELGSAAGTAATGGLAKARVAMTDVAVASVGPGGMAAGATTAATKVGALGRSAGTAATAIGGKLLSGMGSAAAFMGGPWAVALTGAGLAVAYFAGKSAEQKARVDGLTAALGLLAGEYRDLAAVGKQAGQEADAAFAAIVKNNPEMQRAVIQLDKMGIGFDQVMKAATSGDPSAVIKKLNDEIARQNELGDDWENTQRIYASTDAENQHYKQAKALEAMRDAFKQNASAIGTATTATNILNSSLERNQVLEQAKLLGARNLTNSQQELITTYDKNAARIEVLNGLVSAFSGVESTAAQKADAMRVAIDAQTSSAVRASEQSETLSSKLIGLRDQVNQAKDAHDRHATSLGFNSTTALRNRDALEDAATAIREMYLQDIASGKPMRDATNAHNDRITALKKEAANLGLNKTATDKLIKAYGDVPEDVKTTIKTDKFDKVYGELAQLKFIQESLAKGWSLDYAKKQWSKLRESSLTPGPTMGPPRAEGGPIVGPGTGTSDDVLMYGSNGEWVHTAAAVDYYGDDVMKALNERRIPKELLPGFAAGGRINSAVWPYKVNVSNTRMPSEKDLVNQAFGDGETMGNLAGGRGWRWQMAVLRKVFPGLQLYSGYRHSYTANGSLSWHGRDGGRAVDIPPRADVFNWIRSNYGGGTKELIWGGAPDRNIQNGKQHRFNETLLRQHGPYQGKPGPSPHVHWAYDEGGMLPPGESTVFNGTGRPEPVLTDQQWQTLTAAARGGDGAAAGSTYNFEFRDTTLDAGKLRTMQDREAFMAREGRAR